MIKKIIIGISILLLIVLVYKYKVKIAQAQVIEDARIAKVEEKNRIDTMTVLELIDYIAPQYGANPDLIKKIAFCEAGYRHFPVHDGGAGVGTTGYQKNTFKDDQKRFNRPDLVYESNFDQLTMMSISFQAGEKYRNRWTTYVAYNNGGAYTFVDRKGVKHTARCN